jgi:hypothetical protein
MTLRIDLPCDLPSLAYCFRGSGRWGKQKQSNTTNLAAHLMPILSHKNKENGCKNLNLKIFCKYKLSNFLLAHRAV